MARADILVKLIKTGSHGDVASFRRVAEALIADERAKKHLILADRLTENLKLNGSQTPSTVGQSSEFVFESNPNQKISSLFLPQSVVMACKALIEEQHRADVLRAHGLEPRNRVLLAGPPGNGKTSLAMAIAHELMFPLFTVRYETLIGSFLGETAGRLRRLFDHARTFPCVLFFDEFDTLGKERGDVHETGEIKRVVSSLLLQIDALPSYVVIVCATNHPELLDRAVWRRFQLRLNLPPPTQKETKQWLKAWCVKLGVSSAVLPPTLAKSLYGASFAEIEEFGLTVLRRKALSLGQGNLKAIVKECITQWKDKFYAKNPSSHTV